MHEDFDNPDEEEKQQEKPQPWRLSKGDRRKLYKSYRSISLNDVIEMSERRLQKKILARIQTKQDGLPEFF